MPTGRALISTGFLLAAALVGAGCAAEGQRVVASQGIALSPAAPAERPAPPVMPRATTTTTAVATTTAPPSTAAPAPEVAAAPVAPPPTAPEPTAPPATTVPPTTVPAVAPAPTGAGLAPAGTWFDADAEWQFLALTNAARASIGLGQLSRSGSLDAYARAHAVTMMSSGHIHHSNIGDLLGAWWTVGENVGVGPTVQPIQDALLASPPHYENISHGDYTAMGVGVLADGAGRIWTVHVFGA